MNLKKIVILLVGIGVSAYSMAFQTEKVPENWFNLDPEWDKVMGVSTERAHEYLKDREGRKVIVAVIDSGVDIEHEDLQGHIWTNTDEIAGNNVDDDNNGYVDDIHGWNFIGGENGNVKEDTHEMTREYVRLFLKYQDVPSDSSEENISDLSEFKYWKKLKKDFERIYDETLEQYTFYYGLKRNIIYFDSLLRSTLNVDSLTSEDLMDTDADDSLTSIGKGLMNYVLMATPGEQKIPAIIEELEEAEKHFMETLEYTYNVNFNSRDIVGDDYSNLFESNYGNNDVNGPSAKHGTHVAGIIAANRENDIGMKGVTDNVEIMSVRAVPEGDERDKDVANAIRYAVDNGAQIINMSFGKSYQYGKIAVDSAVQYAMEKGVLLVHASGNEMKDRDISRRYPVKELENGTVADNWLEIGASAHNVDENFIGSFSNYGKNYVDVFAPGVEVYSTTPDNQYEHLDGTSMAAPVVSGVAALLLSYYPDLTYKQLIKIITSTTSSVDHKVLIPGKEDKKTNFSELSKTGGIVNAYKAVLMADLILSSTK